MYLLRHQEIDPIFYFHGTNKGYLEDKLKEIGAYPTVKHKHLSHPIIYICENELDMALHKAIQQAGRFNSEPILMITTSELLGKKLEANHNGYVKLHHNWKPEHFVTMDIPTVSGEFDEGMFIDRFKLMLHEQNKFSVPKYMKMMTKEKFYDIS